MVLLFNDQPLAEKETLLSAFKYGLTEYSLTSIRFVSHLMFFLINSLSHGCFFNSSSMKSVFFSKVFLSLNKVGLIMASRQIVSFKYSR